MNDIKPVRFYLNLPSAKPDYSSEKKPEETPSEYHWVVVTAAVAGTVIGTVATGGLLGAVLGGTLLATGAVPLRHYLAGLEDPQFDGKNPSLVSEMIWTGGTQLFFGAAFGAIGAGASLVQAGGKGLLARVAGTVAGKNLAARPAVQAIKAGSEKFEDWYLRREMQVVLRSAAGAYATYDFVTDKEGRFDPKHPSIDTFSGFVAALYAGNGLYSASFGANLYGLDAAVPMSLASYKLFRWLAGEGLTDFEGYNYNELLLWRYVAEGGDVVKNVATYGRAYLRPDLRAEIAAARGMTASQATGTRHVAPAAWVIDNTLGWLYRKSPNILWYKNIIRPQVAYEPGPPQWLASRYPGLAERLTVIREFKNNDMMKPVYGLSGRVTSIGYTWATNVPYWIFFAPAVGMSPGEWGPNRLLKFTLFPMFGKPVQDAFGGDTPVAKYGGFAVGLVIDYGVSQFYNARYKKKHWEKDLDQSLAAYQAALTPEEKNRIAKHILNDIFCRQMTDLSWKNLRLGKGYREFNLDYLSTFEEIIGGTNNEWIDNLETQAENGRLNKQESEAVILLTAMRP